MSFGNTVGAQVEHVRRQILTYLDLGRVPDGHPLERDVDAAFARLGAVLRALADCPGADQEGPLVFPLADLDPRDYPTDRGAPARQVFPNLLDAADPLHAVFGAAWALAADPADAAARVLAPQAYLAALRRARPFEVRPLGPRVN